MTSVRITLTVDLVERDGQVIFSATESGRWTTPIAGTTRGVNDTLDRAGKLLVDRVGAVLMTRFGR